MTAAGLFGAQADAMRAAASNEGAGPFMAFAGMNMAQMAGGGQAGQLFQQGAQQQAQAQPQATVPVGTTEVPVWKCDECGHATNTGKFCANCGASKPGHEHWVCAECGTTNTGKFCENCGASRPVVKLYLCDKCGWEPEDTTQPPKFCPECGDVFDDSDLVE